MSGIDKEQGCGVKVGAFYASQATVAHSATVHKDSHGPLRAVMTGVEHQPSHNEGGLLI